MMSKLFSILNIALSSRVYLFLLVDLVGPMPSTGRGDDHPSSTPGDGPSLRQSPWLTRLPDRPPALRPVGLPVDDATVRAVVREGTGMPSSRTEDDSLRLLSR